MVPLRSQRSSNCCAQPNYSSSPCARDTQICMTAGRHAVQATDALLADTRRNSFTYRDIVGANNPSGGDAVQAHPEPFQVVISLDRSASRYWKLSPLSFKSSGAFSESQVCSVQSPSIVRSSGTRRRHRPLICCSAVWVAVRSASRRSRASWAMALPAPCPVFPTLGGLSASTAGRALLRGVWFTASYA